ncbi:MAG TPA: MBOAT family O-acyltransferase [Elusimicrobiota bacterium]|nr:MBOAT family O-acyltransferase [Elusimicrobiota bacterium]
MLFNSVEFFFFLATVLFVYHTGPAVLKRPLLLAASYVFYMSWNPAYGLLLFAVTLLSYAVGRGMESVRRHARILLWAGIGAHLAVMFIFKYYSFFSENVNWTLGRLSLGWDAPAVEILLPIGISFYVFQSLSYMVDVYRRQVGAERNLWLYMLYISFFPQLVAGPIERASNLLPQLRKDHSFDKEGLRSGLVLIATGLFKKMVLAENLSILVSAAFFRPETRGGLGLYLGALMARYMIYCDIAGYTDIALGCGRAFGIRLSKNFDRPFAARNISEYWQRWHMTLSGWFRDYVFYSLAAGPLARFGVPVLVFVTFLLLGLWHGASWNFVIWGCVNGGMVVVYQSTRGWREKFQVPAALRTAFTFLALVGLPTVFVVTKDVGQSLFAFKKIFGVFSQAGDWWDIGWLFEGRNAVYLLSSAVFIGGMEIAQKLNEKEPVLETIGRWPAGRRRLAYAVLGLVAVAAVGLIFFRQTNTAFVYFQF